VTVRRNHTGHRVGEDHQRAKAPDDVVRRARELNAGGLGYKRIGKIVNAPARTVADWCRYDTRWSA